MTQIMLGSTGIQIEKNGFGCLPIQRISRDEAAYLLHKAMDGGINFFDTARAYTDSEEKMGYAFQGRRDKVIIASKTGALTGEGLKKDLEESLRNLGTDYIDVYQFHNPPFCPKPGGEDGLYDAALEAKAAELWPGCRVAARWSAQDCMPLDGVPYIGPFSSAEKSWFVATGFQKWGMTASMAAARLLSSLMCGEESPWAEVFSPQRFQLSASAKQLFEEGTQAVKGLAREWLIPPKEALEQLAPGRGGILSWQDKKVGAYRDERGTFYLVDPRCPHLGCRLEWNPDELSWDCPCHGSRFDYRGNLLDGPAQEGLRHE